MQKYLCLCCCLPVFPGNKETCYFCDLAHLIYKCDLIRPSNCLCDIEGISLKWIWSFYSFGFDHFADATFADATFADATFADVTFAILLILLICPFTYAMQQL